MNKWLGLILIISCAAFWSNNAVGQDYREETDQDTVPRKSRFLDRVYIGGNVGAQFGRVTFIDISPNIGFLLTKNRKLSAGVGVTYQYLNVKHQGDTYDTHTYGGRVFGRYMIWHGITVQAELEMLNLECYRPPPFDGLQRRWLPAVLLGGGYTQTFGGRTGISLMVFYNFLDHECSPYSNPIFRIGFNVGI